MSQTNTAARTMHDIGLAAWFGGSLMGAIGVNGASGELSDPTERARIANSAWGRWTPVNLAAIAAHVVGGLQLTKENKGRLTAQRGVATTSGIKAGLTAAALGATAYSRVLGQKIMQAEADQAAGASGDLKIDDATTPAASTPPEVAAAQRQLKTLQWAIPALTGALLVLNARMGEQQRPTEVARGMVGRVLPDAIANRLAV